RGTRRGRMIVTFLVERASRAMSLLLHACDRLHLCDTQGSVGAMSARERNSHRHRGSFSSAALDVEPATVALDDVLHDRQAQPGPAGSAAAAGMDGVGPPPGERDVARD